MSARARRAMRRKPLRQLPSRTPLGLSRETSPAGNITSAPPPPRCASMRRILSRAVRPFIASTGSNSGCNGSMAISSSLATAFTSGLISLTSLSSASPSRLPIG